VTHRRPLPTATYTPVSQVRSPITLISDMLADLVASRELAWRLAVRDISAQYRQSILGVFWAFVPPLLSALLFIVLQQRNVVNVPDTGMPYPLFVLVGTTLWQVFAEAVSAPLRVVTGARAILAKINFPREALILSALYQTLFGLFIRGMLLAGVLLYFGTPFRPRSLLALVTIFMLIWLGLAIGLALTPVGMLVVDVSQGITLALQFGFFLTPVVYPAPESFPYLLLATWNPVAPFLLSSRTLLVQGTAGPLTPMVVVGVCLVAGTCLSWLLYRVSMPIIIERISA
jgi:lipopolysaccharide transport system permease protein